MVTEDESYFYKTGQFGLDQGGDLIDLTTTKQVNSDQIKVVTVDEPYHYETGQFRSNQGGNCG